MKRLLVTMLAVVAMSLGVGAASAPAAEAYMNADNCQAGLIGIVGGDIAVDNDVARHINWLNGQSNKWGARFEYWHAWNHPYGGDSVYGAATFSYLSHAGIWTVRTYDTTQARCVGSNIAFSDELYY